MIVYVVATNYIDTHIFGTYTTIARARTALYEYYMNETDHIASFIDNGNYSYTIIDKRGEYFYATIYSTILDEEFVNDICKED